MASPLQLPPVAGDWAGGIMGPAVIAAAAGALTLAGVVARLWG